MNNDMLQNIEYLRGKADVSYEEAMHLLERFDGNVMGALVELEKSGRLYTQRPFGNTQTDYTEQWQQDASEARNKASSFIKKASKTRVRIEKERENGEIETIANVSAPIAAGVTLFAPYVTLAATAIGIATGYRVKVDQPDDEK